MNARPIHRFGSWVFWLGTFVGAVAITRDTYYNGWDFEVFWNAGQALLKGQSPYTFGIENGWSFKYPPWSLVLFLPFSVVPLAVGKLLWAALQIGSIAITYRWLMAVGIERRIVRWTLLPFWFVIHYHALSGQVTLITLAMATLADDAILAGRGWRSLLRLFAVGWAFSLKVFSAVTLVGLFSEKKRPSTQSMAWVAVLFSVVTLPNLILSNTSPRESVRQWRAAASTSATSDDTVVRIWNNQGIPGAFGRALKIDSKNITFDIAASIITLLVLSILWYRSTRGAPFALRWSGWLAIGVVGHPLVWFQSFVLVWPLACFALQAAHRDRASRALGLACFGLACVTMITKSGFAVLGLESFVLSLEELSIKSIGTLFLLYIAATANRRAWPRRSAPV